MNQGQHEYWEYEDDHDDSEDPDVVVLVFAPNCSSSSTDSYILILEDTRTKPTTGTNYKEQ